MTKYNSFKKNYVQPIVTALLWQILVSLILGTISKRNTEKLQIIVSSKYLSK